MAATRRPPARLRRDAAARWDPVVARARRRTLSRRSRPTSAATARRATRGRSTFDACVGRRRSPRRRQRVHARAATRWAAGSRCTSRSPRPSASTRLVLVGATAGHRRRGRARARAAPPTRRSPRAIERGDDRGVRRPLGARSRCSPARRREARGALARATSCATTRAALAAALRGLGTGRDGAAVGPPGRARRCRSTLVAGERDAKFTRARRGGWPARCPARELRRRAGRGPRPAARGRRTRVAGGDRRR